MKRSEEEPYLYPFFFFFFFEAIRIFVMGGNAVCLTGERIDGFPRVGRVQGPSNSGKKW